MTVDRIVDSKNLFCTAAAEHILPYVLDRPLWTVILPTVTEPSSESFTTVGVAELRRQGRLRTAEWLEWAEKHWEKSRKKTEDTPLYERLDTYDHLTAQGGREDHLVLYNASGGRPVACSFCSADLPLPFVARDKTYWASFRDAEEAAFLTTFLNSEFLAASIVDWMTTGLFGARDIHKRALDVPWPKFNADKAEHRELAELGLRLARLAEEASQDLTSNGAGRRRSELRGALPQAELESVEEAVIEIAASV